MRGKECGDWEEASAMTRRFHLLKARYAIHKTALVFMQLDLSIVLIAKGWNN
tara:strand:+ start:244 stop:399 length:156 start_codon:yes stop_codon:yes gene_type:complete